MRGAKRAAISDSAPIFNSNDSFMQSKRVIMGSPFDLLKAEQSNPQPPLDMKRAESSKQHVRALNTQFASWVQAQLQNHPDELWEDGVQDYSNHAKNIMGKFSDVVNWLRANASKGESLGELRSNDAQTKHASDIGKSSHNLFLEKPGFPAFSAAITPSSGSWNLGNDAQSKPASEIDKSSQKLVLDKPTGFPAFSAATTPSFGSWTPGNVSSSNAPFTFGGSQVLVTGKANAVSFGNEASNEADGEDVEQPGSPSVKKSKEEGIVVVHEVKCKLYVKSSNPEDKDAWKDKGMGQLNIKCKEGVSKGTKESKPTIVIRNDVGKLLLNALLYSGIKTSKQKKSVVAIFHTSGDGDNNDAVVARTFLMKTKTEEESDKLAAAIQEHAPAS
ncbi:Pleckstrin homology domain superfamily protein [Perilla frutescens var. hirtella]|nr:Pleckstrin homology domain superfamily protein [Perilla frutescens var. hirtella]